MPGSPNSGDPPGKTNVIDSTGIYFTPNMRHLDRGAEEIDCGQYDRAQYVFGASGAAAFFSALLQSSSVKVLDQLSGEGTTGTQNAAFFAESLFMASLLDQANAWRDGNQPGSVPTDAAPLAGLAQTLSTASDALNAYLNPPAN